MRGAENKTMEWLKDKAWTLVLAIAFAMYAVGVASYATGYQKGKAAEAGRHAQQQVQVNTQVKEKQDDRQDKADEAGAAAEIALAKAHADADAARADGDRVRDELAAANRRATRAATELTGERKAAAERERVYTELLSESTRLVEIYARAADLSYERGRGCEAAWPE